MIAGVSNREFQHIENASWQVADAFSWSYRGPQGKAPVPGASWRLIGACRA